MSGNGRHATADAERWEQHAEAHDAALEQERHLDLVFRELRCIREDMGSMRSQLTGAVGEMRSILDGMNAALGRFMQATNEHEKEIAALKAAKET